MKLVILSLWVGFVLFFAFSSLTVAQGPAYKSWLVNGQNLYTSPANTYVGVGTSNPSQRLDVAGGYVKSDTGFCIGPNCITIWPAGGGGVTSWLQISQFSDFPSSCPSGQFFKSISPGGPSVNCAIPSGSGSGVSSLNGLTGILTLVGGGGTSVSASGNTITISSSGGSGGGGWTDDGSNVRLTTSSDSVGIGTTTPGSKFEVYAGDPPGSGSIKIGQSGSPSLDIDTGPSENFRLGVSGTERLTILTSGNVGIDTPNPSLGKLQVNAGSNGIVINDGTFALALDSTGVRNFYTGQDLLFSASNDMYLYTLSGTWQPRVTVKNNGNVGVGTTNPTAKLDVAGEAKISGISGDGTGKVVCVKSDGNLGTCSNGVSSTGTCSCG